MTKLAQLEERMKAIDDNMSEANDTTSKALNQIKDQVSYNILSLEFSFTPATHTLTGFIGDKNAACIGGREGHTRAVL